MRQTATPHPESDRHVLCPFCETTCERPSSEIWCSGCGAQGSLDGDEVVFDSSRKADRQAVAQADRASDGSSSRGLTGPARRRPRRLGKKG